MAGNPWHDKLGRFTHAKNLSTGAKAYRGLVRAKGSIVKGIAKTAHALSTDYLTGGATVSAVAAGGVFYQMHKQKAANKAAVKAAVQKFGSAESKRQAEKIRKTFRVV